MALTIATLGNNNSILSDQALAITVGANCPVGTVILVMIAAANAGASGVSSISGVVDDAGNTYTQRSIVNYTPGGAAEDGVTLGIYSTTVTTQLNSGADIDISFSVNTPQKAAHARLLTPGGGETVAFGGVDASGSTGNTTTYSTPTVSVTNGYTIFGAAAIESDDAVTNDTDTDNGNWTAAPILSRADGGPDASAVELYTAYKTVTGTGNQTYDPTTATARDSARNYIIFYPSAGGTTYNQSAAGTLTSAGNPVKQTSKPLAGTLTSAGDAVKQAARSLAGTLTSAGDVARQAVKGLAGTLTSAGELAASKVALLSLEGTLTSAGAIVRQTGKTLAGTLTSAGDAIKRTMKRATIGGTLTSAGDIFRQTGKAVAGTLTSAGDVSGFKVALLSLAGTLTSAGDVVRQAGKGLAGTLTSIGTLVKSTRKRGTIGGTLTSAGDVGKQTARTLAGTLTSAGSLLAQGITALVHLTAQARDFGLTAIARSFELAAKIRDFSLTSRTRDN